MNNNNNNNNNNMNNRCKKWSNDEDIRLYNQNKSNMTIQDIANNHQRSELAIKLRIELLAYNELLKSNKTFSEIVSEFKLSENDLLLKIQCQKQKEQDKIDQLQLQIQHLQLQIQSQIEKIEKINNIEKNISF